MANNNMGGGMGGVSNSSVHSSSAVTNVLSVTGGVDQSVLAARDAEIAALKAQVSENAALKAQVAMVSSVHVASILSLFKETTLCVSVITSTC